MSALLLWVVATGFAQVASAAPDSRRLLVLALDAVSFDLMDDLASNGRKDALFAGFKGPVPLVSSFPSTTTLAFTGMFEQLGLEIPPGYEAKFYDRNLGRLRGGGLVSYRKISFSWRNFFDWKEKGSLSKALGYARAIKFGRKEVERAVDAFLATDASVFFVYIYSTDGAAHLKGPAGVAEILRSLDDSLKRAREIEIFDTVILSDHGVGGGEPLRNVRASVKRELRAAGFRVTRRLKQPDDVVLVPFGLLSSLVAFVAEDERRRALDVLGRVEGLALCVTPGPEGNGKLELRGPGGSASLERRRGARGVEWRYQIVRGDPLDQAILAGDWREDRVWLAETSKGRFPDGPHRLARAFDLVANPASVVCSAAPGHMYGPALTEWSGRLTVGRLRWTHGALERDDSLGFLMTDVSVWPQPDVVRFDQALNGLVELDADGVVQRASP